MIKKEIQANLQASFRSKAKSMFYLRKEIRSNEALLRSIDQESSDFMHLTYYIQYLQIRLEREEEILHDLFYYISNFDFSLSYSGSCYETYALASFYRDPQNLMNYPISILSSAAASNKFMKAYAGKESMEEIYQKY